MKKLMLLLALGLCVSPVVAEEEVIALDIEIALDGQRVSNPTVAMKPGSDASIIQGIEPGSGLRIVFHSTHVRDDGAEMLVDIDAGVVDEDAAMSGLRHVRSDHLVMPWDDRYEIVLAEADTPRLRLSITPKRTTREALTLRRK